MHKVDFNKICKDNGIKVCTYSDPRAARAMDELELSRNNAGYSIVSKNGTAILYDDNRSEKEISFTLAHELGHILLGHLSFRQGIGKYPEHMESEANIFASVLIANDILCRYGAEGKA